MRKRSKLVHGVGINDADYRVAWYENDSEGKLVQKICPYYQCWRGMIERGFGKRLKEKHPTYKDVTVCEEWIKFSNFKAWMETQDWEGKQLDKDILFPSNKIYSPTTCCFVDQKINKFVIERDAARGIYPIGVHKESDKNKLTAACKNPFSGRPERIGYFTCPVEAHKAWLAKKLYWAKELAKTIEDKRVADALVKRYENYE